MKRIFIFLVCVFACLYPSCTKNIAGNSTQTGNPTVAAILYNPGGSPAANATVHFYKSDDDPRTDNGDSTETDINGNYTAKLDTGTYNIIAHGDSGMAFQDSIKVTRGDTVKPPADTLKPAGSIKGIVRLEEGGDPTTVFILFLGTRTFTFPDDTSGSFTSDSMAAGTYRVRILTTTPNYRTLDTTLKVIAGTQNVLPDPLVLKYIGIPTPKNVRIVYDTLKQVVTLTWDSANASLVSSYNVYRRNVGLNTVFARINTNPVSGTSYRDSTGVQDSVYEYSVAAVNAGGTAEGTKSATVSVVIASYFVLDTAFNATGTGPGQFDYPSDIAIAISGDIYIVDKNNNRIQVFDSTMHYKRQFGNGILNRPNKISVDSLGQIFVAEYDTIFVFNATDILVDTITSAQGIYDIEAKDRTLCIITGGDSISLYSYDGTKKRGWQCSSFPSCDWVVGGDSSKIFVSNGLELLQVIIYDTLGSNLSAVTLPYYPSCIAVDEIKHRLYTVCLDDIHGDILHVTDRNNVEVANYKIPNTPIHFAEPTSIGLQQNGTIFLVHGTTNMILKLKTLLP